MVSLHSVAFALFALSAAHAQTRYDIGNPAWTDLWVDPVSGNDGASGSTRAQALRTVTAAWGRIPARQTLSTAYRIRLTAGTHTAVPLYWESRWGTAAAPVLVEAADGAGTAILPALNIYDCRYLYLTGITSTAGGGDVVHCDSCNHFLLRQVTITGTGNIQNYTSPQEALKINQSQYVYIEDSDVSGGYDNAIDMVAVQYGHVLRNKVHRGVDWCLYLKGGSGYFRVEGNEFYDCGTGGFTAGQGTGFEFMTSPWLQYEAYDVKFINNIVHDTGGAGFGVNGGYNILLAHNTLYRVGTRSHGLEFVFGGRSCDGDTAACTTNRNAGGWGPVATGVDVPIPNRNVYVYNNLLINPAGVQSQWQHFQVDGPRASNGSTVRSDTNLQIRGNVIVNGPSSLPLGLGTGTGCDDANPTCNAAQLRADNAINTLTAQFLDPARGDYRLTAALAQRVFAIPSFANNDVPAGVPAGNPDNTVTVDRALRTRSTFTAGAYEVASDTVASPITAIPNPVRMVFTLGGSAPTAQSVAISAASPLNFTLTSSAAWLTVTPTAGTTPSSITVSVNTASFTTVSTQNAAITISATGAADLVIPVQLEVISSTSSQQAFTDVGSTSSFLDFVYLLSKFGITTGCNTSPAKFCPTDNVTQSQMAVFVIRSLAGDAFPFPATPYFTDTDSGSSMFKYIQKMREWNINPGCGGGKFCPETPVTRGQMAQYIIRARFSGDVFPYNTTARFTDVPSTDPLFPYVQKMWELGITTGCSATLYCPSDSITREQMAAFILRAFMNYKVQTALPTPPQIAGCSVFPADNAWNTRVDNLPVHSLSGTWVSTIGGTRVAVPDFGSGLYDGGPIGIPYVVVPQNQATVPITFDYDDESDPGPYPVPPNPPIEGGNASDGDRHILIVQQGTCKLWEIYSAYPAAGGAWTAGSGAIYDLNRNSPLRPSGWTSADAAGLPILPGLVRYDEVLAGEIGHAIRFTVPQTRREFIWPARHFASSLTGTQYPPMGARFRLKASYDISTFAPQVQVILRALKKYGMLLADNGSAWFLSGAPDERWDNDMLRQIRRLTGNDFEAVDTSSMAIDANSGQARQ
ncbi:MAG: S-layer homology domain-containing protein [Acidobacteria bacterium]|nr:S-layer homology domain-containing protein [Acidobacteriota bacterium]